MKNLFGVSNSYIFITLQNRKVKYIQNYGKKLTSFIKIYKFILNLILKMSKCQSSECKKSSEYCLTYEGKKSKMCKEHKNYVSEAPDYYYNKQTGKLVVNRIRRAPKDKLTGLPKRYTQGLTPSQKLKYKKDLQKSREYYRKTGLVKGREPVSKTLKTKRSSHVIEFEKRYGFKITDLEKVKAKFPDTDVEGILRKGRAAYGSGGSRPGVVGRGGPSQWANARLASSLTGGKASAVDKDLIGPKSLKIIFGK